MKFSATVMNRVKDHLRMSVRNAQSQPWGRDIRWNEAFISGGVVASLLQNVVPKDYDIYFTNADAMNHAHNHVINITEYIKDVDEKYRDVVGKNGKMITERSITMKTDHSFIIMHHGHPNDVRRTFDYLHCAPYYDISTDKLYISEAQFIAAAQKILEVNNPDTFTNLREAKYIARGYTIGQSCKDFAAANPTIKMTPAPMVDLYS